MSCCNAIPYIDGCSHVEHLNRVNDFVESVKRQFPQHAKQIGIYHKKTKIQSIDVITGKKAFSEDGGIGERRKNCNGSIRITYCYYDVLVPYSQRCSRPKEFIVVF